MARGLALEAAVLSLPRRSEVGGGGWRGGGWRGGGSQSRMPPSTRRRSHFLSVPPFALKNHTGLFCVKPQRLRWPAQVNPPQRDCCALQVCSGYQPPHPPTSLWSPHILPVELSLGLSVSISVVSSLYRLQVCFVKVYVLYHKSIDMLVLAGPLFLTHPQIITNCLPGISPMVTSMKSSHGSVQFKHSVVRLYQL